MRTDKIVRPLYFLNFCDFVSYILYIIIQTQLFSPCYFEYTVRGTFYTLTIILIEILQESSSIPVL